jgi:hypothetical protein
MAETSAYLKVKGIIKKLKNKNRIMKKKQDLIKYE